MNHRTAIPALLTSLALMGCASAQGQGLRDTVYVQPLHPTARDVITFNLYDAGGCCCAVNHYDTLAVIENQTDIVLRYQADEEPCTRCMCLMAGDNVPFRAGPLKAGTYHVYKHKFAYCPPNQPCPAIYPMPVLVGQVTVAPATAAARGPAPSTQWRAQDRVVAPASYTIKGESMPAIPGQAVAPGVYYCAELSVERRPAGTSRVVRQRF